MRAVQARRFASVLAGACALWAPAARAEIPHPKIEVDPGVDGAAIESPSATEGEPLAWAQALPPVAIENANTNKRGPVKLYKADGSVDPGAASAFWQLACEGGETLDTRLLQLVVKAAYHFGGRDVIVISAYRPPSRGGGGKHTTHEAIDFKLRGVSSPALAAYLRTFPRAGVGIYTHPRTQYVHLDVRDQSFHWLDASPPGKTWREAALADRNRVTRDASYTSDTDLPELPIIVLK